MKIIIRMTVLLSSFLLAACDTMVQKQKTILITPPDELLLYCESIPPPNKVDYMKATLKEREELLIDYSIKQNGVIDKCNNTITVLRDWKVKQKEIYGESK